MKMKSSMSFQSILVTKKEMEMEEDYEGQLATAKEFNIPLWYVQMNEICYEKEVEWFYLYNEEVMPSEKVE